MKSLKRFATPVIVRIACLLVLSTAGFAEAQEYYHLRVLHSGKCLNLAWGYMYDGAPFSQYTCVSWADTEQFQMFYDSGYKRWMVKHSSKYVDVQNSSYDHAAIIVQNGYSSATQSQLWSPQFSKYVNGIPYYRLVNARSGHCLNVAYFGMNDDDPVVQASCTDSDNELWDLHNITLNIHGL